MISMQQFLLRQPMAPEETSTDKYYFDLCNRLAREAQEKNLFPSYPEKVIERAALCLIGYFQDVICDAGIWRSFITENRHLYGRTLPFYDTESEYIDFELNKADVRFMVWYALSMNYENLRVRNPLDDEILNGADEWWNVLESVYDESPMPEDYRMTHELEIHAEEDQQAVYKLGSWLFLHCYLMIPAFALSLSEMAMGYDMTKEEGVIDFQKALEKAMYKDPTGPLALYIGEWLYLIIEGKLPPEPKTKETPEEHKYYKSFTEATDGKTIAYFGSYEEMNRFFVKVLGWEEGKEHLAQVKGAHDYILMVDKHKGMLMARNIARCIADPENPYYDKTYASTHAIDILTERGCCPGDLLRFVCEKGWLPDAVFPLSHDHELVARNWDFIARCYLQEYYRGD